MRVRTEPLRVLDFDCEARPLNYLGADYTNRDMTVVAWKWIGEPGDVEVRTQTTSEKSIPRMLADFRRAYDAADMVVGHNIRRYDLGLVSGMFVEFDMPPLSKKLTSDTLLDLPKMGGVNSKSQENLAELFGVEVEKVKMTAQAWREANRLTKSGVAKAIERAAFDVLQNIALRDVLIAKRLLGPPKVWRP